MSTVLWANLLHEARVTSDEIDKFALYKHSKKLDKLTRQLGVRSFLSAQDFTDLQFNLDDDDLPQGIESTEELMAQNGTWMAAQDAVEMLGNLIRHIDERKIKFGFFNDDREDVLQELEQSLVIAERANSVNGMFNFSVVM